MKRRKKKMKIQKRKVKNLYQLNVKWQRFLKCRRIWSDRHNNITLAASINPPMIEITDNDNQIKTIYYVC